MKRFLGTIMLFGVGAAPAIAQSNVTLFGVVDLSMRQVRNDGSGTMSSVASGANAPSRFGIRGTEDLGNGLTATFHLESTVMADTGMGGAAAPAGQFFDRRSTLSLISKQFGEIRVGRDLVPTYTTFGAADVFGYVGVAGATTLVGAGPIGPIRSAFGTSPNTLVRSSNALQYFLPSGLGGLEGNIMLAPKEEGLAANGQHKYVGGRLGYAAGPLRVAVATANTENNLTGNSKFKDTSISASYDFESFKLSAAQRVLKLDSAKQTNFLLSALVRVGEGELKGSYHRANLAGTVGSTAISANDASQYSIGYLHNLSKRTALYTTASRISNSGAATYAVPGGPAGITAGGKSTGFEFGLRHNF
jgi:predicted porin